MRTTNSFLAAPAAPVAAGFLASLLLSLIAVLSNPILNRDGMLYVVAARNLIEMGVGSTADFDWSFYPLLIAGVGRVTGLDLEFVAHSLNALFIAGACALMIDLVRRRAPELAWVTCLVVLAMPAYNGYRDFVIREFGYWFFCTLSFWLAMRWEDRSFRWQDALGCQAALLGAVLFRLEATVFFPALLMWQVFSAPRGSKLRRSFMITWLPLTMGAVLLVLLTSGKVVLPGRVLSYASAANFLEIKAGFQQAADALGANLPIFSRGESGFILLTGLLAFIPAKFTHMLGVFVLPMGYSLAVQPLRTVLGRWSLLSWAFFFYLLTLAAFIVHQLFVSARYVSMLNLLAVPYVAAGFITLMARFPKLKKTFVAIALITMLSNVASLSPGKKAYIKDAGQWLAQNTPNRERVYVSDSVVAFYAGWPYKHGIIDTCDPDCLKLAVEGNEFDIVVLSQSRKSSAVTDWVETNHLRVVRRFANKAGDAVVILAPAAVSGLQ
jgi:hypothetical protein